MERKTKEEWVSIARKIRAEKKKEFYSDVSYNYIPYAKALVSYALLVEELSIAMDMNDMSIEQVMVELDAACAALKERSKQPYERLPQ